MSATQKIPWSQAELAILREFYPVEGSKVIERLPGRTPWGTVAKVAQMGLRVLDRGAHKRGKGKPRPEKAPTNPQAPKEQRMVTVRGETFPARTYPPKSDYHNAEKLEGLPWLQFPTTAAGALKIAKVCGEALRLHDEHQTMTPDEAKFWASVKQYMHALAERFRKAAA